MPDTPARATALFTVHTARRTGVGAIIAIYSDPETAEALAQDYSRRAGITFAAVTAFDLDVDGSRRPVSWFVEGKRQHRTAWPTEALPVHVHEPDSAAEVRRVRGSMDAPTRSARGPRAAGCSAP